MAKKPEMTDITVGSIITDYLGRDWKVQKLNKVTVGATRLDSDYKANVHIHAIESVRSEGEAKPQPSAPKIQHFLPEASKPQPTENIRLGSVVKIRHKASADRLRLSMDTLFVVTKVNDRTFSMIPLGGHDSMNYYRFGKTSLTLVDPARISVK